RLHSFVAARCPSPFIHGLWQDSGEIWIHSSSCTSGPASGVGGRRRSIASYVAPFGHLLRQLPEGLNEGWIVSCTCEIHSRSKFLSQILINEGVGVSS